MLQIFLKVVQKLHKEHLSSTPAPDVQTAPLISDLLQLGLDMCKTRISMMPQESRKAFINIMTNLIEKSSDAKLLRVITKIVEEWVKSKVSIILCTHVYLYACTSRVLWLKVRVEYMYNQEFIHKCMLILELAGQQISHTCAPLKPKSDSSPSLRMITDIFLIILFPWPSMITTARVVPHWERRHSCSQGWWCFTKRGSPTTLSYMHSSWTLCCLSIRKLISTKYMTYMYVHVYLTYYMKGESVRVSN